MTDLLIRCVDSEVLGSFSAVHFNNGHSVATIEARVLTLCKFVEFVHSVFKILAKGAEYN